MEVLTIDKPAAHVRDNGAITAEKPRQDLVPRHENAKKRRLKEANKAYGRGMGINTRQIKDKKLRSNLKRLEHKYQDATVKVKDAEILLENTGGFLEPEGELERTFKVRQDDIAANVAVETAQKRFDLKLDQLGPYICDFTRNGRNLLLAGRKGHVATMDWREGKLGCELQLKETVRDVRWLHNNQYFAVAQKKHVFIYDHNGVELHCLRKHAEVTHMEFLPYHFLLSTIVSPQSIRFMLQLLTSPGHRRQSQVHGHLDRPARRRDADAARAARLHGPEPLQRRASRRTPKRHGDALVAKLARTTCQAAGAPWPRQSIVHGPRRTLHGFHGPGFEDGRLGCKDV